jgi:hypothetical protein
VKERSCGLPQAAPETEHLRGDIVEQVSSAEAAQILELVLLAAVLADRVLHCALHDWRTIRSHRFLP